MSKVEASRDVSGRLERPTGVRVRARGSITEQRVLPGPGLLPVSRSYTLDNENSIDERLSGSFHLSSDFGDGVAVERLSGSRRESAGRGSRFDPGGVRLAIFAGITGCLLFAVMSDFGRRSNDVHSLWPVFERIASSLGLGIDQVILSGHHYTPERDLFDALRLGEQRTFLSFHNNETLRRLEQLSWVKSASIVRVLPGQLEVRIVEREAFALWQRGGELLLIDATGRVLSATEKRFAPNLPMVSGLGAASEVASLMRLVASCKILDGRLLEAVRVSKRRWSLHLTKGVRVHLPAEGAAYALATLRSHPELVKLLLRPHTLLDLRVSGRVAVRSTKGKTKLFLVTTPGSGADQGGVPG